MRKAVISLLLILCPLAMFAQQDSIVGKNRFNSVPVKHFEGEILLGYTVPLGGNSGKSSGVGSAFGYEFRYNTDDAPLDFSLQVHYTSAGDNKTSSIAIFGDWNFGQGQSINPFAGFGLGWAEHSTRYSDGGYYNYHDNDDDKKAIIIPRVGVELFRHLRLTLSSNISGSGYNNLQLSVGVVFGGGKK